MFQPHVRILPRAADGDELVFHQLLLAVATDIELGESPRHWCGP
ncbi:hypothetical protein [Escherichia coli]